MATETQEKPKTAEKTADKPKAEPKPLHPGYRELRVLVHESAPEDFSEEAALTALAESMNLKATSRTAKNGTVHLSVDTEQSFANRPKRGRQPSILSRDERTKATKAFRDILKNPEVAARVAALVEKSEKENVDVSAELMSLIGLQS